MTSSNPTARWLLSTLLSTALGVTAAACSDSDSPSDTTGDTSPSTTDAGGSAPDATTGTTADATVADPNKVTACLGAVYSELSDSCSACACNVDTMLAPTCGKPCWEFLACSFTAQAGPCAAAAAGGMATRPAFEACTMKECGALLGVPGAELVSGYRSIIGVCANSMGGAPVACTEDIAKINATLQKP